MSVRYPHLSLGTHTVFKGFFMEKNSQKPLNEQEASGEFDGYNLVDSLCDRVRDSKGQKI